MKKLLSLLLTAVFLFALCIPAFAAEKRYKNVIIMIGDGMGENHLKLAEQYGHTLFMNTSYDLRGQSRPSSASHITTDSAAGGTALAIGNRVINWTVGVLKYDPFGQLKLPISITEASARKGMKTGVITTDKTTGATPADFTVHVLYRKQYEIIGQQQLESEFDLIWGAKEDSVTREAAEAHGWTYVTNRDEMTALEPGSRSYAQFSGQFWRPTVPSSSKAPSLAEMTTKAIDLLNTGDNGFFLMVEGAHIDKNSHASENNKWDYDSKRESTVDAVVGFDNAIRAAVDFARKDGNTVVLVTADHETGNLFADLDGKIRFHYDEHTAKNVPVFVYCNNDIFKGGQAVDNYTIPRRLTALLGWEKDEFPATQSGAAIVRFLDGMGVVRGDVDADGKITAADARLALRAAVWAEPVTPFSQAYYAANVDLDAAITATDARHILRAAVGLESPKSW